jgi:TolA-binding protein
VSKARAKALRRLAIKLVVLVVLVGGVPGVAAAEITLKLQPPDLSALLPLAVPPLDKPQVPVPAVSLPASPQPLPELPTPPLISNLAERPVAPLPPPRILACNPVGTILGAPRELLECGRARFQRREFQRARDTFQKVIQGSTDRALMREARYWLGETLVRLYRVNDAEAVLLQAHQDDPRSEQGYYAAHELGWLALELKDSARALTYFDMLLNGATPAALVSWASHGRALALYGLKRYAEARDTWLGILNQSAPRAVGWEGTFWLGDTLGSLGDYNGAIARLEIFTNGGPQLLIDNGLFRRAWWSRAAGQPLEAVKTYRALLSAYPQSLEALWARAGLVQALLDLDDYPAAREEARQLAAANRSDMLALPTLLLMSRWLTEKVRPDEARELNGNLLARNLEPTTRAYVLVLGAEVARRAGKFDEARDGFELVRTSPGSPALGLYSALRLAQIDFETREFTRAEAAAEKLLGQALPAEFRLAALVLAGEAAYWAHEYGRAAKFYSSFLSAMPGHPLAAQVDLALAWTELRVGKLDGTRQRLMRFAERAPGGTQAAASLVLRAELSARGGDLKGAQALLEQVIDKYPSSEYADVATLNRAILTMRAGSVKNTLPELDQLIRRGSTSPYLGRMHTVRGVALLSSARPVDAEHEFELSLGQGDDAMGHLGLGNVAYERQQWDQASGEYAAARDAGSGAVAVAAEYGLAAVNFAQGKIAEFKQFATGLLARPEDPVVTLRMLQGMAAVAVEEKRWPAARVLTLKLADQFPTQDAAAVTLSSLAAAASQNEQWPLALEMYAKLAQRYPGSAAHRASRLDYAEALLRTGTGAAARRELEAFVAGAPDDARRPRAVLLLARAQEATGDRASALDLYARVARDYPSAPESAVALLGEGGLLQAEGKWTDARSFLEQALNAGDTPVIGEAAYRLGEGLRATGNYQDAVELYMTAAYVAPDSPWARHALLGAGQAFAALKQTDSAVIVYRKLLDMEKVEADLVNAARKALRALGITLPPPPSGEKAVLVTP